MFLIIVVDFDAVETNFLASKFNGSNSTEITIFKEV